MEMVDLSKIQGFDWDSGNIDKNEKKHGVRWRECEEVFDNKPLSIFLDHLHSNSEKRYEAFGRTNDNILLTLIFTIRNNYIRVISARKQSRKEKSKFQSIISSLKLK